MRKSPFSTPRGNGNGRPGYGWKSNGSPNRGYGRPKNFEYYSPNHGQNTYQSFSDDFIPLSGCPTPSNNRKSEGNWTSPISGSWLSPGRGNNRQSSSPGLNNSGNNRGYQNNRPSPYYKNSGNSFRGNRKSFHRGNDTKNIDISRYVNLRSFLEDPWEKLSRKYDDETFDDSLNDNPSDLSLSGSILDSVRLDDSIDEKNLTFNDPSGREEKNDSFVESKSFNLPSSQESVELSSEENSLDPKISQDSKD